MPAGDPPPVGVLVVTGPVAEVIDPGANVIGVVLAEGDVDRAAPVRGDLDVRPAAAPRPDQRERVGPRAAAAPGRERRQPVASAPEQPGSVLLRAVDRI